MRIVKLEFLFNPKCMCCLVTATSWFNDQAYHAVAVALNAIDNAILKNVSKSKKQITVTNHPLPRTLKQKSDDLDEYVNKFLSVDESTCFQA
jgi:hypothetical protein